jgi:formylglycine-generating enzyme required for sulfatase activity
LHLDRRSFLSFPFLFPTGFDSRGRVTASEPRSAEGFSDALPHGAPPLEMVQIPGGSLTDERGRQTLVSPFSLGRFEVTNQQWNAVVRLPKRKRTLRVRVLGKQSPFGWEPEQAVEMVAFDDCVEFCARVARLTGRAYRLPAESEWQYACRGGTRSRFWWGEQWSPALVATPGEKAPKQPGSTGFANAFGIYDIVGNVDEWVAPTGKGKDRFHLFHATASESDWLSEKFVRNGLGFRVAV